MNSGAKALIDIEDFANETLICGEPNEQSRNRITQRLRKHAVSPKKIWTVSLGEMAIRLVANGAGIAVLNAVSACYAKRVGVVVRPLAFDIRYDFQIILPLEKDLEPAINNINAELIALVEQKIFESLKMFG